MAHIIIIEDGLAMCGRGSRIVKVASFGGAIIHEKCGGWENWEAELAILKQMIDNHDPDIDTQLSTLEGMMPSE